MITITCQYKGKMYEYNYVGEINISIGEVMLGISWYVEDIPPQNPDELHTWCSNGFDYFEKQHIISVTGL